MPRQPPVTLAMRLSALVIRLSLLVVRVSFSELGEEVVRGEFVIRLGDVLSLLTEAGREKKASHSSLTKARGRVYGVDGLMGRMWMPWM